LLLLLVQAHELEKGVQEALGQALLLGRDPRVVVAGQQGAAITLHGARKVLDPLGTGGSRVALALAARRSACSKASTSVVNAAGFNSTERRSAIRTDPEGTLPGGSSWWRSEDRALLRL
jgi:hypothetical protein